jgi:hypothetical protein
MLLSENIQLVSLLKTKKIKYLCILNLKNKTRYEINYST